MATNTQKYDTLKAKKLFLGGYIMIVHERVEIHSYVFGGFILIAKRYQSRYKPIWVMICQDCGQQLPVKKIGSCYWVAVCKDCKIEYTITPSEVFKGVELNLERVM